MSLSILKAKKQIATKVWGEAYIYALQTVWYNATAVFDVHLKSP